MRLTEAVRHPHPPSSDAVTCPLPAAPDEPVAPDEPPVPPTILHSPRVTHDGTPLVSEQPCPGQQFIWLEQEARFPIQSTHTALGDNAEQSAEVWQL